MEETKAIEKLEREFKECSFKDNTAEGVVGSAVVNTLKKFCEESVNFSRKVLLSVPTVGDCIKAIVEPIKKEHKQSVSDLEVFASAVKFYSGASAIKCIFEFSCTEESEAVTDEQIAEVTAQQEKIKAEAKKAKAEEKAKKEAEEAARKAKLDEAKAKTEAKKEETTQQLSLFNF